MATNLESNSTVVRVPDDIDYRRVTKANAATYDALRDSTEQMPVGRDAIVVAVGATVHEESVTVRIDVREMEERMRIAQLNRRLRALRGF